MVTIKKIRRPVDLGRSLTKSIPPIVQMVAYLRLRQLH